MMAEEIIEQVKAGVDAEQTLIQRQPAPSMCRQLSPDEQWLISDDWINDVASIHPASDNWICFALSDGAGGWTHKWCSGRDIIRTLQELKAKPDFLKRNVYVSQLEFSERKRTVNSVAAMNVSFLDLDGKLAKNQTPEEWRDVVLAHCRRYAIPEPNEMVFSGNGIHVKWIYTYPASRSQLERWSHIERLLFTQFGTLGADAKALDAARVLRVPGTINCKPGTADNHVRIIHSSPAEYTFDEFAAKVEASKPVDAEKFSECLTISDKSSGVAKDVAFSKLPDMDITEQSMPIEVLDLTNEKPVRSNKRLLTIPCNFVALSRCPGGTIEEKAESIRKRCREYREVGIPEPNRIFEASVSDTVIAEWSYSDVLPMLAVSRWNLTQDMLCRHFEEWGAMDNPENLNVAACSTLSDFEPAYHAPDVTYSFSDLAKAVLPFTQKEVRAYRRLQEEPVCPATKWDTRENKKKRNFSRVSEKRYLDILHLLELRKDKSGNVREGCRELCLFWAINFAIQSGRVTIENFDTHAQSIIDFCGPRFRAECGVRALNTLKNKLANGKATYSAGDKTLIEQLEITEDEQREMATLRADKRNRNVKEAEDCIPRKLWLLTHPQERSKNWRHRRISRATFFRRKRAAKAKAEEKLRKKLQARQRRTERRSVEIFLMLLIILLIDICLNCLVETGPYIMRGGNDIYHYRLVCLSMLLVYLCLCRVWERFSRRGGGLGGSSFMDLK